MFYVIITELILYLGANVFLSEFQAAVPQPSYVQPAAAAVAAPAPVPQPAVATAAAPQTYYGSGYY